MTAVSLWFFVCIAHFLSGYSWFPPLEIFTSAMLLRTVDLSSSLILFLWAAWSLGSLCLKAFKTQGASSPEKFLLAMGLGLGCLGLIGLGCGLSGHLRPVPMIVFLVFLAGLGCAGVARSLGRALENPSEYSGLWKIKIPRLALLPLLVLIVYGIYGFLISLGPNTFYDSLVYHTALPDLYLRLGRISPTPFSVYSGIPSGVEMLYLWLLPLDPSGSLCQTLHWSLGIFTAAAIIVMGKRISSLLDGLWAAAIFYSTPMVLIIGHKAGVELGSSFYLALALLSLILYDGGEIFSWLLLAGIFMGLDFGTKYQMILLLPAAAAFLIHRQGFSKGWRAFLWTALTACVIAAPWGIKNIAFYGNPIYPFFDRFFSSASVIEPWGLASSAHARHIAYTFGSWTGFRDFAIHIWSYCSWGELDNLLSPVFLMMTPLLIFFYPRRSIQSLLIFTAAMWIPMNALSGLARFSIPALVPFSLSIACLLPTLPGPVRLIARYAAIVSFCLGGLAAYNLSGMSEYWQALKSPADAAQYLAEERSGYPNPPYAAFQWANTHLPPKAKVLLIGDERPFYLERNRLSASLYVRQPLLFFIETSSSSTELYQKFLREGITHVLINKEEYLRTHDPLTLSAAKTRLLDSFWKKHLQLIHVDPGTNERDDWDFAFYRLAPSVNPRAVCAVPYFLIKKSSRK